MVTVRSKLRHITTTTSLCICKCISILFYFIPRHSLTGYLLHFLISDWTPYSTLRNARPLRFKDLTRPRLTAKVQSLNDGIEASLLKLFCDHIDQTTKLHKEDKAELWDLYKVVPPTRVLQRSTPLHHKDCRVTPERILERLFQLKLPVDT